MTDSELERVRLDLAALLLRYDRATRPADRAELARQLGHRCQLLADHWRAVGCGPLDPRD